MRESPMKRIEKAIQEQGQQPPTSKKIPARFKREEIEKEKTKPTRQVIAVGPETPDENEECEPESDEMEPVSSHFATKRSSTTRSPPSGLPPPPDSLPFRNKPSARDPVPPRMTQRGGDQYVPRSDTFKGMQSAPMQQKRRMFDDPEEVQPPHPAYKDPIKLPEKKGFFGFGRKSNQTSYVPPVEKVSSPQPKTQQGSKRGALKGMISLVVGMLLLVMGAELNGTINTAPIVNKTLALLVYGHSAGVVAMVIGGILIFTGYSGIRASKSG